MGSELAPVRPTLDRPWNTFSRPQLRKRWFWKSSTRRERWSIPITARRRRAAADEEPVVELLPRHSLMTPMPRQAEDLDHRLRALRKPPVLIAWFGTSEIKKA